MHRGFQLSLLSTWQGRGYLFGLNVLEKYLDQHQTTAIPNEAERVAALRDWLSAIENTKASEPTLEHEFVNKVMGVVLGYAPFPTPSGVTSTIYPKPGPKLTNISGIPDAALGKFSDADRRFIAVVELKKPGAGLDTPQPSYGYRTPVEQAFDYGKNILGVQWVVVSDMRVLRLYSVEAEDEYDEINLAHCLNEDGSATETFRKLIFLFHYDYLIDGDRNSQVATLYVKSAEQQIKIRDGFYSAYYYIRANLYEAIAVASATLKPLPDRQELLEATQRLLDRMLFIYYCEDHPQQLIPKGTIEKVTTTARQLPGHTGSRVYEFLKYLFREIDSGSPPTSGIKIPGYNGELFKRHRVIDEIDLPDALHDRLYRVSHPGGERIVKGVWGLHVYDFWTELNEHLLGHIFEESLSDLDQIGGTADIDTLFQKIRERKAGGIFYTSRILADFLCASAIRATLGELSPILGEDDEQLAESLRQRINRLLELRAIDFACGSGAFLTALYRELLQEYWRLQSSLASVSREQGMDLLSAAEVASRSRLLPACVFGVDKLPQAAEIAKLAVWLRSARKDQKVLDLSRNIFAADSLELPEILDRLGNSSFDIIVGNPPWGGDIDHSIFNKATEYLGLSADENWDSWELFVLLAIRALREGGRLALVLPDSLLYPQKSRVRRLLFEAMTVEKLHVLGPDWFGPEVRMGTVVLQARKGQIKNGDILCALLAGDLRKRAIAGEIPLTQIEAQRSRWIPTARVTSSETCELEVFRGREDDRIIETMIAHSQKLSDLCERARGEEINKAGDLWVCPGCLSPTTPGTKRKGGGFNNKPCEKCGHLLTPQNVEWETIVSNRRDGNAVSFIDGDDINRRYLRVNPRKWMRLGLSGWKYKDAEIYRSPKILLRQAGVGICATLDLTGSRCPQSVYVYRVRDSEVSRGYAHEFVLAAVLSRTMNYLVFKRFAEVDVAKAHAKLTHERLSDLPIPLVDFSVKSQRRDHDLIVEHVGKLLSETASLGGVEDREIEQKLRGLWGLTADDGAYINGEFYDLPDGQAVRDLFPNGPPKPVATVIATEE